MSEALKLADLDGPTPIHWPRFWATEHGEEQWLVPQLAPLGRMVAIYAPAKAGKSEFVLFIAARLATGQTLFGWMPPEKVDVVYLDYEMTEGDLKERLEDMGYGPEDDLSHLHYYQLPALPPLDTAAGGTALMAIVERHSARLVVIDTTARVVSGPENDSDTYRDLYLNTGLQLKATGVTVIRLDHAGKDLRRGQRGSSAKADDADVVWKLARKGDDKVLLEATHRRQAWVPQTLTLSRSEDAVLRYEIVPTTVEVAVVELVDTLDALNVPVDFSRARVRERLKEQDIRVRNGNLSAAIRLRRSREGRSGTSSVASLGTPSRDNVGYGLGDNPGDSSGQPGKDTGDQWVSPYGDTLVPVPSDQDEIEDLHPDSDGRKVEIDFRGSKPMFSW